MKKGRKILEKYLKSGDFVFHGTYDSGIKIFQPRQAYNEDQDGLKYKDGNLAVFASIDIEIPIFFALFNHENIDIKNSKFAFSYFSPEKIILKATKNKIEYFENNKVTGYVYVFEKKDFFQRKNAGPEMVSEKEIRPFDVVEVTNDDIYLDILEIKNEK